MTDAEALALEYEIDAANEAWEVLSQSDCMFREYDTYKEVMAYALALAKKHRQRLQQGTM